MEEGKWGYGDEKEGMVRTIILCTPALAKNLGLRLLGEISLLLLWGILSLSLEQGFAEG